MFEVFKYYYPYFLISGYLGFYKTPTFIHPVNIVAPWASERDLADSAFCTIIWSAHQYLQYSTIQCYLYHHLISTPVPTIQYSTVLSVSSSDQHTSTYNTVQYSAICTIIWSANQYLHYRTVSAICTIIWSAHQYLIQYSTVLSVQSSDKHTSIYSTVQYSAFCKIIWSAHQYLIQYSTVLPVQLSDKHSRPYSTIQYRAICTIIWSAHQSLQ